VNYPSLRSAQGWASCFISNLRCFDRPEFRGSHGTASAGTPLSALRNTGLPADMCIPTSCLQVDALLHYTTKRSARTDVYPSLIPALRSRFASKEGGRHGDFPAGKLKRNNLPHLNFHVLRHTSATFLISKGMDIETVAGRLGHSTSATTQNVYSHFLESKDRQAADIMEDVFSKKKVPSRTV